MLLSCGPGRVVKPRQHNKGEVMLLGREWRERVKEVNERRDQVWSPQ